MRFRPKQNEALTSWLFRLGIYYYLHPSTFFLRTIPEKPDAWKQDLDVSCPLDIVACLSMKSGLSCDALNNHILARYRKFFDPYVGASSALPRWVSPAYIRRKSPHHFGYKYCSDCLEISPHHILLYRLSYFFGCSIHHLLLHDRCPECQSPISCRKVFPKLIGTCPGDALCFCYECGFDYRNSNRIFLGLGEIRSLNHFEGLMRTGVCELGPSYMVYSHLYFQGLRLVVRGLFKLVHQGGACDCFNAEELAQIKGEPKSNHDEIEFISVGVLRILLVKAHFLLSHWPNRFLDFNKRNDLIYSSWIMPRDVAPHWFSVVANFHLKSSSDFSKR